MASSGWMDVEEGVAGGQMAVQVVSTQEPDFEDTLLERLDNTSEKKAVGGAVRWALVINDHNSIDIMLQGLPHPTLMHAELVKMYGCLFKPEFITRNEAVGKLKPACYLFSLSSLAFHPSRY